MIALLGPPPADLITRYHSLVDMEFPEAIRSADGPLCKTAEEVFEGTFFGEHGMMSIYPQHPACINPEYEMIDYE